MLKFAFHMLIAEQKKLFRGAWWFIMLLVGLAFLIPFVGEMPIAAFSYWIIMSLMILSPKFSKIHYVVPVNIGFIRKYFICRILLVVAFMLFVGCAAVGTRALMGLDYHLEGFVGQLSFLIVFICMGEGSLEGFHRKKGFQVRNIFSIGLAIVAMVFGIGIVSDYADTAKQMVWVLILLLIAVVYMIIYLKDLSVEEYTTPSIELFGSRFADGELK